MIISTKLIIYLGKAVMKKIVLASLIIASISGCATVFTGTSQSIHLAAVDGQTKEELKNVNCSMTSPTGNVYPINSNPAKVVVSKDKGPLMVKCDQPGYHDYNGVINSEFNGITLLDVLFWPTFFVDYGTGAMNKYPGKHSVEMQRKVA
jgi:hypothetical protein